MSSRVVLVAASSAEFADVLAVTTTAGIVVCGVLGFVAEARTPRKLLDNIAVGAGVGTFVGALGGIVYCGVSAALGA